MRHAIAAAACAMVMSGCAEDERFVAGLRATADDAEKLVRARREFSEEGYDLGEVSEFP